MNQVNVFITVDTEHSIGGAFADQNLKPVGNEKRIFGRIGGSEYGIPLIMDIADRNSIPLTFFVEVLNKYYFGEHETQRVCQYILDGGQDVQLHLHPNYLNFKESDPTLRKYNDNISNYDIRNQTELILEGKELLSRYCGRAPVAFRAGSYCADHNTLVALKTNGIPIDSSYNAAYLHNCSGISPQNLNGACHISGVWELPITNFTEHIPFLWKRFKPLDINGVSFAEIKKVLETAHTDRFSENITIIMHSFSFIKAHDIQYNKCSVRNYVIKRFEKLCRYLQQNSKYFRCWSFAGFADTGLDDLKPERVDIFPQVDTKYSLIRGFEQKFFEHLS